MKEYEMKEKILYTCEICKTDYADKEKAEKCEKAHIKATKIVDANYHSIYCDNGSHDTFLGKEKCYPTWIKVQFSDGEVIRYKR